VHLWAERFDGDAGDLFALQDEITNRIAVALDLELVDAAAARPIEHPDALDYILRGRAARLKPPSRGNRAEQVLLFEQALALDPESVAAQSWLAIELVARALDFMTDTSAADIARAEGLAARALAAAPRRVLPGARYCARSTAMTRPFANTKLSLLLTVTGHTRIPISVGASS
jgi:hypothetical protein